MKTENSQMLKYSLYMYTSGILCQQQQLMWMAANEGCVKIPKPSTCTQCRRKKFPYDCFVIILPTSHVCNPILFFHFLMVLVQLSTYYGSTTTATCRFSSVFLIILYSAPLAQKNFLFGTPQFSLWARWYS